MGLFTKPVSLAEAIIFIEALRKGDDNQADPLGERIFKTKNKSVAPVTEALMLFAEILSQRPEAQAPSWSARQYTVIGDADSEAVRRAKTELSEACFGSGDPTAPIDRTQRLDCTLARLGADPSLSNIDRIDSILSMCFVAARIGRELDFGFPLEFKYG